MNADKVTCIGGYVFDNEKTHRTSRTPTKRVRRKGLKMERNAEQRARVLHDRETLKPGSQRAYTETERAALKQRR